MQEERCHQASFASEPIPSQSTDPDMPPGETESEDGASNLGELAELKAELASFLEGSLEMSDGESEETPPELAVSKFANWVRWKVGKCDTPGWWAELSTVPGEDDTRRLAQVVKALFQPPRQMHELEPKEAPFQAPPVLPCLHCQRFMPPVMSIYASHQGDSQGEGNCVCQSPAAFCQTKQPTKEEGVVPIGGEHHGTEEGSQILFVFH